MNTKQRDDIKTNTIPHDDIIPLYNTLPTLPQYLIHNLYRILRLMRRKYNLTVNEVIYLNSIHIYNRFVNSDYSLSSIEDFAGYYNSNKIKYYNSSLIDKGMIRLSGIHSGYNRYMLTEQGIEVIKDFDNSYMIALEKFKKDHQLV